MANLPEWERWDKNVIRKTHGDIFYYRDLYAGNHAEIFPRAKKLKNDGQIIMNLIESHAQDQVVRNKSVPYIVANVSKLIPEIPAMLVSRAIGRISPAMDEEYPEDIQDLQKIVIEEIEEDSNLTFEHYTNILQHQIDGGLVGLVTKEQDDIPIISMKARDTYFPHGDGRGGDLVLEEEFDGEDYLHIYRERIERDKGRDPITKRRNTSLYINHFLYKVTSSDDLDLIDEEEAKQLLGLDSLNIVHKNRRRGFIEYLANNKTFDSPLGVSALKGQESKQEEINWTLTRNALVFEVNGKPKIGVSKATMRALRDMAFDKRGNEEAIDVEDLEIFELSESGETMSVIQVDVDKIGKMDWIKDLMKIMFVETQTSEKAVDFYIEGGGNTAQSGIAKFYDLFSSIIKAEKIAKEYIRFLQNLFESALWLERELGGLKELPVERPDIALIDMIPISRKELIEQESIAYEKKIQSRFETVKKIKPHDSDKSIEDELALLENENISDDSDSLATGRKTLSSFMDNRDEDLVTEPENSKGDPLQDDLEDEE